MVTSYGRWLVGLMLLVAAGSARAADSCEATVNRTSVPQGGEVMLTVATRGDMGWSPDFELPDLPGVRVYAGGTNQSMTMVNGRTETSVARTYYLKVETATDFTIGPVVIRAGDRTCRTEPIAITVTAAEDRGAGIPPAQTGNRGPRPDEPPAEAGAPGDDIFITLEADNTEAWLGQQIVLTFRYWRRVQPWNNPSYTPPRTEGFWREDLGSEQNYRKVLRGRAYNVTEIRYAIFPTRVGDLVVEPAELTFPAGVFDRFFQTQRSRRGPNTLRTDPVTIHVRPLPTPAPADYAGIVATSLDLTSEIDRTTVPRGEAVGLKVKLVADGFLKGFSDLPVPAPEGARLHDAGESYRTAIDEHRLTGRITVEKVIVPDKEGPLQVPAVQLVWFDAAAGRYRTARADGWRVDVTASDRPLAGADESGFLRNEVARLGDDLAFIHQVPGSLRLRAAPWTGGAVWWALLLLPLALLGAYRLVLARWAAALRDPAGRRRRAALATARARLTADEADRASAVVRAICGYVADCRDVPPASIGPAEVRAHCDRLAQEQAGRRLTEILTACDAARYGRADASATADLAAEAARLLAAVEAASRRSGAAGVPLAIVAILLPLLVLGAASGRSWAQVEARPGTDPARLLAEGNQAYTEGRLEDATARYLAARDLGVNDPVLHFNLGNTYARSGLLGRAVASYLRAERLAPRDRDVKANLAWVRRHIRDLELGDDALPLFIAQLAAVVGALTLDEWSVVLLVLLWGAAVLVALGWYREAFGPGLRRALLAATALLLVATAVTAGRWYDEQVVDAAVVVVPEVVVRSGPAENFSALFEVHDGLTLNITGRREGWVKVGMGGDWEGWMPAEAVVPVRLPPPAQGR